MPRRRVGLQLDDLGWFGEGERVHAVALKECFSSWFFFYSHASDKEEWRGLVVVVVGGDPDCACETISRDLNPPAGPRLTQDLSLCSSVESLL